MPDLDQIPKNLCSVGIYPVRNNAPLLPPGQRPSGPAAAAGLHFRLIPAGFNAPLEFLTGFTADEISFSAPSKWGRYNF